MKRRRSLKPCATPGCPELTTASKCATHQAVADAERGNWRERGYDAEYERNRKAVLREETLCWLCNEPVDKSLPGTARDGPTADHVIRREDGGTNRRENLRLAHLRCNAGRKPHGVGAHH